MGRREPITAKSGGVRPAWVDGEGLRPVAYVERKARLRNLLRRAGETIRYFDYVEGDAGAMLKAACSMELKGNDLRKIGGIKIVRTNGSIYRYHRATGKRIKADPDRYPDAFFAEMKALEAEVAARAARPDPKPASLGGLLPSIAPPQNSSSSSRRRRTATNAPWTRCRPPLVVLGARDRVIRDSRMSERGNVIGFSRSRDPDLPAGPTGGYGGPMPPEDELKRRLDADSRELRAD